MTDKPNSEEILTGEILPQNLTTNLLAKYDLAGSKIDTMREFCASIYIKDAADKVGYKNANMALTKVKKTRTAIEAKRKELKAPILEVGKAIDAEAKRLTLLIEPIESALQAKVNVIDKELELIEVARKKNVDDIMSKGFDQVGNLWQTGTLVFLREDTYTWPIERVEQTSRDGIFERNRMKEVQEEQRKEREELDRLRRLQLEQNVPEKSVTPDPFANIPPVIKPESTLGNSIHKVEHILNNDIATTNSNFQSFEDFVKEAKGEQQIPNTFEAGYASCKQEVLDILQSDMKLTRAQWIEKINSLNP